MRNLPELPKTGILNLFVRHTSCGLSLNENYDPDVRYDLKGIFERLVPDGDPRYLHQDEGPTDMSAHAKSSMVGVSLTIPITHGRLNLGTWQGIYYASLEKEAEVANLSLPLSANHQITHEHHCISILTKVPRSNKKGYRKCI